jgi:hypothetical protein
MFVPRWWKSVPQYVTGRCSAAQAPTVPRYADRVKYDPDLYVWQSIYVDGVRYIMTGSSVMNKGQLAAASIFEGNELLLVTCAQKADGNPSTANLVVMAMKF